VRGADQGRDQGDHTQHSHRATRGEVCASAAASPPKHALSLRAPTETCFSEPDRSNDHFVEQKTKTQLCPSSREAVIRLSPLVVRAAHLAIARILDALFRLLDRFQHKRVLDVVAKVVHVFQSDARLQAQPGDANFVRSVFAQRSSEPKGLRRGCLPLPRGVTSVNSLR